MTRPAAPGWRHSSTIGSAQAASRSSKPTKCRPADADAREPAAVKFFVACESFRRGEAPERRASRSATTSRVPTPPTSTAGMAPSQAAITPARKSPSWLEVPDEQRIHRVDAAAHLVGGLELNERHADHDADRVRRAEHRERGHRQDERLRQREHEGREPEAGHAEEHDAADASRERRGRQDGRIANAPTAGAARNRPSPSGPVWKTSRRRSAAARWRRRAGPRTDRAR